MFDPIKGTLGPSFYSRVSVESCVDAGMTTDASTVKFWEDQLPECKRELDAARDLLNPDLLSVIAVLKAFTAYLRIHGNAATTIWAKGSDFDIPLLTAAYAASGQGIPPWDYARVRDARTVLKLIRFPESRKHTPTIRHHALYDAQAQALSVCEAYDWAKTMGLNLAI
jgi:hypothetical protein